MLGEAGRARVLPVGRALLAWPRRLRVPPRALPYLFLLPGLALYGVWIVLPALATLGLSLTHWDGVTLPRPAGLDNFRQLLRDPAFAEALGNNLRWLAVFVTVPTTLGLALALLLNTERRGGQFYKFSFYAPLALSLPVVGLLWSWLYNPRLGLLNGLLALAGVHPVPGWLGDRELALWAVIGAAVWRQVGYVMVLYLAGLRSVDPSLLDAARVDGASGWPLLRRVLLPLLAPATTVVGVVAIVDSLRAFDLVSVMTGGGQGTQVLATLMYQEAFNNYRMGYGAAIAAVLFGLGVLFTAVYLRQMVQREFET